MTELRWVVYQLDKDSGPPKLGDILCGEPSGGVYQRLQSRSIEPGVCNEWSDVNAVVGNTGVSNDT